MRLLVALLLAVVACGTSPAAPPVAAPATRRSFHLVVPADADGVWTADGDTVDGNDAWHLTWNTTRDTRVTIGGRTFTFAKGERNHAIVVSATNADFRTVYDEGHRVVFSMRIGP
jgi:hypothetical protein